VTYLEQCILMRTLFQNFTAEKENDFLKTFV